VGKVRRSDRERGAALVEAAFVTPILIMLLLGTVTAALAYSENTSLQTAAREASRFGATLPVNGDLDGWLVEVLDVAQAAGGIDLAASAPGQYICVAYVYPDGAAVNDRTSRRVQSAGVTGAVSTGPSATCFDDGRPDNERRVQVVTKRATTIQAVLFSVNVNLSTPSAARFERGT
jgi:Flp pilus assembly protein TadG